MNEKITHTASHILNQKSSAKGIDTWFNEQAAKFEAARFFWMAIFIIAQSCLGSVACMFILKNHASDVLLASCAAITMLCNSILIAQGPGKWCIATFYLSIILNSIFIIVNI
ncbi:MAG: hypothetical protein K0R26_592 [Bacteroidota bacterium]|jgi:hypothetical protein|nr:hypothetical protein [Bacteroidota bacterium]